jgi:hypothetical protein
MSTSDKIPRYLAVTGTVLAWFPILAPIVLSLYLFSQEQIWMFDFLIPAEIFPVVVSAALLLIWAAFRAHLYRARIGWSFLIQIAALTVAAFIAQSTGLASGKTQPVGMPVYLVGLCFLVFWLALISMAVGGALLWNALILQSKLEKA